MATVSVSRETRWKPQLHYTAECNFQTVSFTRFTRDTERSNHCTAGRGVSFTAGRGVAGLHCTAGRGGGWATVTAGRGEAGLHCTAGRGGGWASLHCRQRWWLGFTALQAEGWLGYNHYRQRGGCATCKQSTSRRGFCMPAMWIPMLFTALSYITRMLLVSRTGRALYRPYKARQCKQHPHGLGTTQKHHQFPGPKHPGRTNIISVPWTNIFGPAGPYPNWANNRTPPTEDGFALTPPRTLIGNTLPPRDKLLIPPKTNQYCLPSPWTQT